VAERLKATDCKSVEVFLRRFESCLSQFYEIKVRGGLEPPLQDLQSNTLPLCYLTFDFDGEYNLVG
jgi:hypothetical protein